MTQERDGTPEPTEAAVPAAPAEPDTPATVEPPPEAGSPPVTPPPVEAAAPPPSGGAAWRGAVAALLVVLIVLAAAAASLRWWAPMLADAMGTAGEARLAAAEGQIIRLHSDLAQMAGRLERTESEVTALRDTPAAGGTAADNPAVNELAQRVARLEAAAGAGDRIDPQTVAALTQDTGRLAAEVNDLKERVATLAKSSADAATVLRLADRVDAAEAAAREAAARRGSAQALLLAVGQLREAVNRGDSFESELKAVGTLLDGSEAAGDLEKLARYAQRGIPTRLALSAAFEDLSGRIVRANFGPEQNGWWRQTVQRLASLITVRRTEGDEAGRSSAALVAQAQHRLAAGDLAGAVAALSGLEGPALETAGPWMAQARARVSADKTLSDLTAQAVAMSARSEG